MVKSPSKPECAPAILLRDVTAGYGHQLVLDSVSLVVGRANP